MTSKSAVETQTFCAECDSLVEMLMVILASGESMRPCIRRRVEVTVHRNHRYAPHPNDQADGFFERAAAK
jgi:transposase